MVDRERVTELTQVQIHLCGAPGIAGGDRLGASVEQVPGLARTQVRRGSRLEEVVDARRAAADLGLGADLEELELGDRPQKLARGGVDALGVLHVAGIVVGDAQRYRAARRA